MKFEITEHDIQKYRTDGYHIIPQVIPASLLTDLRREATKARELAYRVHGPQTQRLGFFKDYADELDLTPFKNFTTIDGLNEAVQRLTSSHHQVKPAEDSGILFSPQERPWSTEWHRDWRDHVLDAEFQEHVGDARWKEILEDGDFFNQINCPLYEDTSTWYVPGSHLRVHNTDEEMAVYLSTTQEALMDEDNQKTDEELELTCLRYCQSTMALPMSLWCRFAVATTTGALEELDDKIKELNGSATLAPMDITTDAAMATLCRGILNALQRSLQGI